jgi:TolB protein
VAAAVGGQSRPRRGIDAIEVVAVRVRRPLDHVGRRQATIVIASAVALAAALVIVPGILVAPGTQPDTTAPGTGGGPAPTDSVASVASVPVAGEVIVFASDADGDFDLYALDAGDPQPRRLTRTTRQERSPAISPDGRTIAYVVGVEPTRDIWLMDADGSNQRRLTTHPADDSDPAWSGDGRSLAFASRRGDVEYDDIIEIRDRGSGLREEDARKITARFAIENFPEWAPSGRRLAIASNHLGANRDIFTIDADDPDVLLRRTATFDYDFQPAWSPDGGTIAFYRRPFCASCYATRGMADLMLMDSRGENVRRLTNTPARDEIDPDWSPDGRWIVFAAGPRDEDELFARRISSGKVERLTKDWANAVEPSWGVVTTPPVDPGSTAP